MDNLNKDILLIMPNFFGMQKDITEALEAKGYNVILYSDRPNEKTITKTLIRVNRHFKYFLTKRYVKKIINETQELMFYRVIVIGGQSFCQSHLKLLFKNTKCENKIYYIWDSLSRYKYTKKNLAFFDKTITFNIHDYKTGLFDYFLPLYIPEGFEEKKKRSTYKYDMCFIGTTRPSKYEHIVKLRKEAKNKGLSFFEYLYLPTKAMFYYFKFTNKHFRCSKRSEFNFTKMPADEIKDVYNNSKYIVDAGVKDEGGLSLRVFESIGNHKKLILTNQTIIKYDFYHPNNFYVFDNVIDLSNDFFNNEYQHNDDIIKKYRIFNWVGFLVNPQTIPEVSRKLE